MLLYKCTVDKDQNLSAACEGSGTLEVEEVVVRDDLHGSAPFPSSLLWSQRAAEQNSAWR